MKIKKLKFLFIAAATAVLISCGTTRTVPITGRKQNILVSDEQILSLSNQEYTKYMQSVKRSTDATNTAMVKRVGKRLATAVENYLVNNGLAAETKQFSWEFNLVQDKSANAFCMPGGKIVVYEGLLPYTQNEAALAVVLGHEIAHAVAKHSAEQMSKQIKNQLGVQILGTVLGATVGDNTAQVAQAIAQSGLQFRTLKFSRNNETEADHMGLIFAAMAGYDPRVAIAFWQRMAQEKSNQNDMFSDHPSDAKRIAALRREMPEALKYYKIPAETSTVSSASSISVSSLTGGSKSSRTAPKSTKKGNRRR